MIKLVNTLKILIRKFGFRFKYLIIPLYRFFYSLINFLGFCIDQLFYAKYKNIKLNNPVFLIGHPRSGTTFLHKFLINNCPEFEGMPLWKMIFPSIFLRKLIKPMLGILDRTIMRNLYDPKIHKTGLFEVETDDAAIFFKQFDGMFHWLYFSAWQEYKSEDQLNKELIESSALPALVKHIRILYQKNLLLCAQNKRIFSKSFSLILDLDLLKKSFNNSKILIMIRDPLEVIPSSFSLARHIQNKINPFHNLNDTEKNKYFRNLYQASLLFYRLLVEQLQENKLNPQDYFIINYKELLRDFDGTMQKIIDFCDIQRNDQFMASIKKQVEKQQNFSSKHKYSLEEFGFTKDEVLKDFDFLYQEFSF